MNLAPLTAAARSAVAAACNLTADVAAGLARTAIAASSTLAVAVMQAEADVEPAAGRGPGRSVWIPAAPPPYPPVQSEVAEVLDLDGSAWLARLESMPPRSPWQAPDDLCGWDGCDSGPVTP